MADKVIAIKIDVQGTNEQRRRLAQLEKGVKELTDERKRLNKALKDGTISLDQYSRELARVNTQLRGTRRELSQTRNNMLGINSLTDTMSNGFRRLGSSISTAFVGFFALQKAFDIVSNGIKTIKEFELQMAKVAAITGATAVEMEILSKSAKDLGRNSQFTATEVGQLQEELAKLGFTTPQVLDSSEAILQLATAMNIDLAEAAEVAASTVNAFGLTAKDTQDVVDLMAESFSSTPLDIERFRESMKLVAPTAKSLKVSLQDTTAMLGLLAKNGISGSIAGTQLNRVFIELNKKGIDLRDAMDKVNSSTDKLGVATELVGDRGAKALQIFADQSDQLDILKTDFQDSSGEAKRMADTVGDTAVGAAKKLDAAWEGLVLTIGDGSEGAFASFKSGLADILNDITDFISERDELLESGRNLTIGDRYFGLDKSGEADLAKIREEQKFLKDNLKDREKLLEREAQLVAIINVRNKEYFDDKTRQKRINDELTDEEEDRLAFVSNQRKIEQEALANIREQLKGLKEVNKEGKVIAGNNKKEGEDAVKTQVSITEMKLDDLKKLKTEEAEIEIKRRKEEEKTRKETLKAEEKLAEKIRTLKQEQLVLEIEDKRQAEFQKLSFAEENAIREVELTIANETKKVEAIKAIQDKYQAQRDALAKQNAKKDEKARQEDQDKIDKENQRKLDKQKTKDDADKEKEEADKEKFEKDLAGKRLDVAQELAEGLVTISNRRLERQKTLELANLDARLEAGLISQEDFEKEREAIERKAFQRQKRLEIAQIGISLARELASIAANSAGNPLNAFTFGTAGAAQNIALAKVAIARSAVQAGIVASQKFEDGGLISGASHANGGVPFTVDGVGGFEAEGGEAIINKRSTAMFAPLLSAINQAGGGVAFASPNISSTFARGGVMPSQSGVDMTGLRNEIAQAVTQSIGAIKVQNVATDTISEAVTVSNIQQEAQFG